MEFFGYLDILVFTILICCSIMFGFFCLFMELDDRVFFKGKNTPFWYVLATVFGSMFLTGVVLIGILKLGGAI